MQQFEIPGIISMLPFPASLLCWHVALVGSQTLRGWSVSEGLMRLRALVCGDGADSLLLIQNTQPDPSPACPLARSYEGNTKYTTHGIHEEYKRARVKQNWEDSKYQRVEVWKTFLRLLFTLIWATLSFPRQRGASYDLQVWSQVSSSVVTAWRERQ